MSTGLELVGLAGGDGAGKSTITNYLGQQPGIQSLYFTDGNYLGPHRAEADKWPPESRFTYYLGVNLLNFARFALERNSSTIFVMDRTPLATFAYHEVMGVDTSGHEELRAALIGQFSKIIYVHANRDARERRMLKRLETPEAGLSKFDQDSLDFSDELDRAFRRILPKNATILDTSSLSIREANLTAHNLVNNR